MLEYAGLGLAPISNTIHRTHKVLGIMGAAGVGKTSVADILVNNCADWTKLNFADVLKEVTAKVFKVPLASLHLLEEKEAQREPIVIDDFIFELQWEINQLIAPIGGISSNATSIHLVPRKMVATSYRQLLQYIGTNYVRYVCDSYWVDYVTKYQVPKYKNVALSDVRFENEVKAVRELGGLVVAIERDDVKFAEDHPSARNLHHLADCVLLFPPMSVAMSTGWLHIKNWANLFVSEGNWKMYEANKMRAFLNTYKNIYANHKKPDGNAIDDCANILGITNSSKLQIHQIAADYGIR